MEKKLNVKLKIFVFYTSFNLMLFDLYHISFTIDHLKIFKLLIIYHYYENIYHLFT